MNRENNKEDVDIFLRRLAPKGNMSFRQITTDGIPSTIGEAQAMNTDNSNIYFLGGVRNNAKKFTDLDIQYINYLRFDIDIKKGVQEFLGTTPDRQTILDFIDEIMVAINKNHYLSDWAYIVYSGGGCHIYYSNQEGLEIDKVLTPEVFKLGMKRIYTLYDKVIGDEYLHSDKAVCNTARIMRLPGSINQKNGEKCLILYSQPQDSNLFGLIKDLGLDELEKKIKKSEVSAMEIKRMREELIKNGGGYGDTLYQVINQIPAYIIAQMLIPGHKFDGKKNFKNTNRLKGYFYLPDNNSICNGGSHDFDWGTPESCWNNYSLVKNHLSLSNKETFDWFKREFRL